MSDLKYQRSAGTLVEGEQELAQDENDTRSPLERFRTPPKKALSVTDLVSPAWCELQYWYTLKHHGKKKRTPAMKEGSKVHKQLEDQVHTTVKVDIETKEDAWGLRIWNVIQGLRTLRETGLTRELEVWGVVDGLVVNGVIDELSYDCPDPGLESRSNTKSKQPEVDPNQRTLQDFFQVPGNSASLAAAMSRVPQSKGETKIYLGDVKTRAARSLPNEVSFRPTKMQLMLYHSLLDALARDTVQFDTVCARYGLDAEKVFSDAFIVQVGDLNDEAFHGTISTDGQAPPASQDSVTTLLENNNLELLWKFMISELKNTIPSRSTLGNVLKAEYRSRTDGEVMGSKTFLMNEKELAEYISHEMEWWRGKREAHGVSIQEAFKCRICEFADGCEWRLQRIDDAREKTRSSRKEAAAV